MKLIHFGNADDVIEMDIREIADKFFDSEFSEYNQLNFYGIELAVFGFITNPNGLCRNCEKDDEFISLCNLVSDKLENIL